MSAFADRRSAKADIDRKVHRKYVICGTESAVYAKNALRAFLSMLCRSSQKIINYKLQIITHYHFLHYHFRIFSV